MEVRELNEAEAIRFDEDDLTSPEYLLDPAPVKKAPKKRNLTEIELDETQAHLVAEEGLSVEEALTVTVGKIPVQNKGF